MEESLHTQRKHRHRFAGIAGLALNLEIHVSSRVDNHLNAITSIVTPEMASILPTLYHGEAAVSEAMGSKISILHRPTLTQTDYEPSVIKTHDGSRTVDKRILGQTVHRDSTRFPLGR